MELIKEEILQLEYQLIEAIQSSNTGVIEKMLHDDLLFLAPDGKVITKTIDLLSHQSGDMFVEQLTPEFGDLTILGDTAVSIVTYHTKGTMLGKPIDGQFRYIRVWKACNDGIKIIGGSCLQAS